MPALKALVAKIDEVDEKYRDLYVQKGEKWELQVEGMKTPADVDRVNQALIKERKDHGETATKLKDANTKLEAFGDHSPESIQAVADKLQTLEAANTPELAKNFEKIVTERVAAQVDARVKTETSKLSKKIEELTGSVTNLTTENSTLKTADQHRTIDEAVRAAASKAKVLDAAVPDALMHARGVFSLADGKVVAQDGQTPEDWIEARKQTSGHWWPRATGTGSMGDNGQFIANKDNPWSKDGWNLTAQGQVVRADPQKADQLAKQAGSKVGATAPPK